MGDSERCRYSSVAYLQIISEAATLVPDPTLPVKLTLQFQYRAPSLEDGDCDWSLVLHKHVATTLKNYWGFDDALSLIMHCNVNYDVFRYYFSGY